MEKHRNAPTITSKFPIAVPLHECYSTKCIFKVRFGKKKYYIGKAKSFLQSCEAMAILIDRGIKTGINDSADWYYHVINYCNKARVVKAVAEMVHDGSKQSEFQLLKAEQIWLDKCKNDEDCLNNNFDAYIPKWIPANDVKLFNKWKNETKKSKRTKNRAANTRKKHKGGQLAVRSNRRVPSGIRPKAGSG